MRLKSFHIACPSKLCCPSSSRACQIYHKAHRPNAHAHDSLLLVHECLSEAAHVTAHPYSYFIFTPGILSILLPPSSPHLLPSSPLNLPTLPRQKLTQPLQRLLRLRSSKMFHRLEQMRRHMLVQIHPRGTAVWNGLCGRLRSGVR